MPNSAHMQAQLDAAAQQKGFKNYAQWAAYQNHIQQDVLSPGPAMGPGGPGGQPAPSNWLQRLLESIPGHPAQLFRYIDDRMGKALGNGQ